MKMLVLLILAFLVACSATTQERLEEIRVEKDALQRYMTVCALEFPTQQRFCHRTYGARRHELICEEARLKGERCTDVYKPD